jgi:hypothetical protein
LPAPKGAPERRGHPGIAYDPRRSRLVMFGSNYQEDPKTWLFEYASNTWKGLELTPHPPVKKVDGTHSSHPSLAYDAANDVMLCLIVDVKQAIHATWVLELNPELKWKELKPAAMPDRAGTRRRNLSYSQEHNLFILELAPVKGEANEIWTYRYQEPPAAKRPQPPTDLVAVTDAGKVSLQWKAGTSGLKEFRVHRAAADKAWQTKYEPLAVVKNTSFADGDVTPGKTYFYRVSAVDAGGSESELSLSARTQPRVLGRPIVSVLAKDKIEVSWNAHPAADIAGYNVYRGLVSVHTVKKGTGQPWRDNDPEYPEPLVKGVADITNIVKLNEKPIAGTSLQDTKADLTAKGPESGDYKYAVYAYIVRAVNRLGTESGPSPYALTIPAEPRNVLVRNAEKDAWELKWDASPEKGIAGYRVYKTVSSMVHQLETKEMLNEPRLSGKGGFALWVTAIDALGQEGAPSSPARVENNYRRFFSGEWHQ